MTRTRSLFAAAVLALTVPTAMAGCGGDDASDESPQEVIDATFQNDEQITSGVLDLSLSASAGDQGSFEASLSGPFQGVADDPTVLPQLDLTAAVSGEGAGQSVNFEGGLVVSEDNAFVEYGGETYEVGTETFSSLKESMEASAGELDDAGDDEDPSATFREGCEQALESQGGDPAACDFDIGGWFTDLTNEGSEDVEGAETVHISGAIDVPQLIEDLTGLAGSVPGAEQQVDQAQIDQVSEAITSADFDLYSGTEDDILRKLDFGLTIDPSAIEGATPVPVDAIDFGFSFAFSEVNEEQTVDAPEDAQPIEDLLGQFGVSGLGPIDGLDGLGGDFDAGGDAGGGGGGGAGSSDAYLDCIAAAGNDPEQAADCLDEL